MNSRSLIALVPILFGLSASTAVAVDGVKLLKQPVSGVFPITINSPGSYRLKGNITVPDANATAILVAADRVTIDLNGFSITGPTVCSGAPTVTSCAPLGTGNGIDATGRSTVTVKNGTVHGMGNVGILIGGGSIDRVTVFSNGSNGIEDADVFAADSPLMVTNCTAKSNGGSGILATSAIDCIASFNQASGFFAAEIVSNCSARLNAGVGIGGFGNLTTVTNSNASGNGTGINVYLVTNSSAVQNVGYGIQASVARGCAAALNGGTQINAVGMAGQNTCNATPCP